jgi:hypothetical protein
MKKSLPRMYRGHHNRILNDIEKNIKEYPEDFDEKRKQQFNEIERLFVEQIQKLKAVIEDEDEDEELSEYVQQFPTPDEYWVTLRSEQEVPEWNYFGRYEYDGVQPYYIEPCCNKIPYRLISKYDGEEITDEEYKERFVEIFLANWEITQGITYYGEYDEYAESEKEYHIECKFYNILKNTIIQIQILKNFVMIIADQIYYDTFDEVIKKHTYEIRITNMGISCYKTPFQVYTELLPPDDIIFEESEGYIDKVKKTIYLHLISHKVNSVQKSVHFEKKYFNKFYSLIRKGCKLSDAHIESFNMIKSEMQLYFKPLSIKSIKPIIPVIFIHYLTKSIIGNHDKIKKSVKLSYSFIRLITCKILYGVFNDNDVINKIGTMMTKIKC